MHLEAPEQKHQETQKKYVFISFTLLFLCAVGGVVFACMQAYKSDKEVFMSENKNQLERSALATLKQITEWGDNLKNQTERISSSELYRLFAKEVGALPPEDIARISESTAEPSDDNPVVREELAQVSIMRNVLHEFVKYGGILDARIVNGAGQILLATSMSAAPSASTAPVELSPEQLVAVRTAIEKRQPAVAPLRMQNGTLVLDYVDPFHSTLSADQDEVPVGVFMITVPVTAQITRFLNGDARQGEDTRIYILQNHDSQWDEVRPDGLFPSSSAVNIFAQQGGGFVPFGLHTALTEGEAYSLAIRSPFGSWWILAGLPRTVVDEDLNALMLSIGGKGLLACCGFLLLLPLLWWFSVGRGQHATALRFRELYHTIQQQKQFLDNINISLEVGLFMSNENGEIQLCNRAFASIVRREEATLYGANLESLFQEASQKRMAAGINHVLQEGKTISFEVDRRYPDSVYIYRVALFPFVDSAESGVAGVVGTMQDVTDFRRRTMLQQRQQMHTMNAFMRAIESVDPYLAGHSQMMKAFSLLIGKQLGLANKDTRTITMAAELSQVGKLSVPADILRKESALTEEEMAQIRRAPENAYSILQDISFDLPVADAVYAMNERMDGAGYPRGLQGKDIHVHARVLGVLNAFCAMTSPRFYRQGMTANEAVHALQGNGGFDQTVVHALYRVLSTPEGMTIFRQRRQRGGAQQASTPAQGNTQAGAPAQGGAPEQAGAPAQGGAPEQAGAPVQEGAPEQAGTPAQESVQT